jgi:hypothetical protein
MDTIDIGGHGIAQTRKWQNAKRHPQVAFVVDDVLPPSLQISHFKIML